MNAIDHVVHLEDWRRRAACRGYSDLFWPAPQERDLARVQREAAALAICALCPSLEPCRAWARAHREPGIWGGETQEQRAADGYEPIVPGAHIRRARRTGATAQVAAALATGDLPLETVEAIQRLIAQGDPRQ